MDEKLDEFAELLARIRSPKTRAASDALMNMADDELAETISHAFRHHQSEKYLGNLINCGSATASNRNPKDTYDSDNACDIDEQKPDL